MDRWAIEWYSKNKLDGETRHFMWELLSLIAERRSVPRLYNTRQQARDAIKREFGYIATRPDLRREPHGWRMPRAVKVRVQLVKVKA